MPYMKKGFTLRRTLLGKNLVSVQSGFTLIELLVVLSIMGILIGLTLFGVGGARASSRDAKRKADLELIRSGVEVYRADCNNYPIGNGDPSSVLATNGINLVGDGTPTSCAVANVYIGQIPADPRSPNSIYRYYSNGTIYEICTILENGSGGVVTCGSSSDCGSEFSCNYKITNP